MLAWSEVVWDSLGPHTGPPSPGGAEMLKVGRPEGLWTWLSPKSPPVVPTFHPLFPLGQRPLASCKHLGVESSLLQMNWSHLALIQCFQD